MPSKTTKSPAKPAVSSNEASNPLDPANVTNAMSGLVKEVALKAALSALRVEQAVDSPPSNTAPAKSAAYSVLVEERKVCTRCSESGLTNPASDKLGHLDSDQIGPWTRWNGDLDARLLVVGQEWGDVASFVRQGGVDTRSPTNQMLCELLAFAGVHVAPAPAGLAKSGVFLTNAALCLKEGGAQAEVKKEWFLNCGLAFLRAQVQLVRPTVVVSLGEQAYLALRHAFALPRHSFRRAANRRQPISLPTGALLVPVYHCGQRILNGHRRRHQQFEDWALVQRLLSVNHEQE